MLGGDPSFGMFLFAVAVLVALLFLKWNKWSVVGIFLTTWPVLYSILFSYPTFPAWLTEVASFSCMFLGPMFLLLVGQVSEKGRTLPEIIFRIKHEI